MPFLNNVPIPHFDPIVQPTRFLTEVWERWFDQLQIILEAAAVRVGGVSVSAQGASIAATDFSDGALDAGLYRISYYARITQAATVSSSLIIGFDWTDGGVSQSFTGAAITGNTTATSQSGSVLIHVDALSPVRYSTTYASVGATSMQYDLYITLEEVQG